MTNPLLDSPLKPPPPPSELDELMSRDPLSLSSQDIDKIIQYQRAQRARRESGKGKKASLSDGSGLNLAEMMKQAKDSAIPKAQMEAAIGPAKPITRPSGFRRI